MSTWSPDDLSTADTTEEIHLSSRRPDGTLRPFVTMWMVVSEGDVYVRSAYGVDNGWYRRAVASGEGRVTFGGVERDVRFASPDRGVHEALDGRYHAKYDRYGPRIVGTVVGEASYPATLRLEPID
jgi:hypothetical protein